MSGGYVSWYRMDNGRVGISVFVNILCWYCSVCKYCVDIALYVNSYAAIDVCKYYVDVAMYVNNCPNIAMFVSNCSDIAMHISHGDDIVKYVNQCFLF